MNENFLSDLVVVKRSGQRVSFNGFKIALAIKKAFDSQKTSSNEKDINKVYESTLNYIKNNYEGRKTINVEDIQDIIENELLTLKYDDVFSAFKEYREKRRVSRELFSEKEEHKFTKATTKIINAYGNYTFYKPIDILLNFGKTLSLEYTKAYLLESKFLKAHEEGKIFINNLEFYSFGLFSSSFLDFSSLDLDIIKNIARESSGEVSVPNIDYILESTLIEMFKKIFKKNILSYLKLNGTIDYINTVKLEIELDKQNSLNIENKYNNFILNKRVKDIFNIAYEDSIEYLKEKFTIKIEKILTKLDNVDIKLNKNIFSMSFGGNSSKEGNLINEILLSCIKKLDLKNVKFIYKIYKKKENNYIKEICDLITHKKNISLLMLKNKNENYKLDKEYFYNGNSVYDNVFVDKKQSAGRMIVDNISINMMVIALKNNSLKDFYEEFESVLEISKNSLVSSFEFKSNKFKDNFKYLFKENLFIGSDKLDNDSKIRRVYKQGSFNIELVGLKECVYLLKGKNKDALNLGFEILEFARKKLKDYSINEKLNFALSNISEEKVLKNFMSINKSIYGIIENITDKEKCELFESIFEDLEIDLKEKYKYLERLEKLYNGGFFALVTLPKKCSISYIKETIEMLKEYNIEFIKFKNERKN